MNTKIIIFLFVGFLMIGCSRKEQACIVSNEKVGYPKLDSLQDVLNWTEDRDIGVFTGPDCTPSPACMAVAATGEVFVGVDMMGSFGKEINKGLVYENKR